MEFDELNKTISYLEEFMKNYKFDKDEINIEIKYDELCELNYYFEPSCVIIRKKIHDNYVKKLSEKNKLKRSLKSF